tara:strand:- start:100 stop:294 length:195 start_codon:yes stop_codon:yes gene_type:complete
MIMGILNIIKHVVLILYVSFIVSLILIGVVGEFVVEDKRGLQEFLVVATIFTPIYLAFLWGKNE